LNQTGSKAAQEKQQDSDYIPYHDPARHSTPAKIIFWLAAAILLTILAAAIG
jgi:hypothetical protein